MPDKMAMRYLFFLWIVFSATDVIFSQEEQAAIKLVTQLEQLQEKFEVDFSYNYTLLEQINIPAFQECSTLASCLNSIGELAPVTFKENGTNNFMVIPVRKDLEFSIIDSTSKESITTISVQINNGLENYYYPKKSIFTIKDVFALDSIRINSAFYKSIHLQASDLRKLGGTITLEQETINLNEVVITDYLTRGINAKVSDNSIFVDMKSLGLLAGETDGDIFNVIKNIPGVHNPSGKPGSINFRGNTFDQSLIQIDDIPIYHTGHFFGALSPYNPEFVDEIEIQRNTLHAKWGGRVGGLINMTTSNIVPDSATYGLQTNTIFGGAAISIPLIKDKLAVHLAGRTNYPGISSPKLTAYSNLNLQGSRLESIADEVNTKNLEIGFYDINAKLVYDINTKNKVSFSFIDIQNKLAATLEDTGQDEKVFRDLDLGNWGMNFKWESQLSEKLRAQARFSRSSLVIGNVSEGFSNTQRSSFEKYTNTIDDTRFIGEFNFKLDENTNLETGYTLTQYGLGFSQRNDQNSINNRRDQNATMHSSYFSVNKNWDNKVTATIGLHGDYYNPKQTLYADPRVLLNIKINHALYLKTSAGRSHQFIQKKLRDDFDDFNDQSQFWFLPDRTTDVLRGYQTMIGALYEKSGWLLDLELYQRNTSNVTQQNSTETLEKGKLKGFGTDFFVKKRWNKFETMFSYSLNKVSTEFDNATTPVYFDQRHIFNVTGLWHLNAWNFAATWGYFSGMPVVVPEFISSNGAAPEDAQILNSDRFPNQHQLDVSATYTFTNRSKNWNGILGLSLVNLYNQDNIINLFQNAPSNNSPFRKAITFSPNVQLSLQF